MDFDDASVTSSVQVLMYANQAQTPADRRKIREKYQELIEDAKKEKEKEDLNTNNVMHNMSQADDLFKNVLRPQEAIYDAKLVSIHSEIAKKHANQIQIENPFNSAAFLRKLAFKLTGTYSGSDVNLGEEEWLKLGESVSSMFNMTPKLNFIQGTFPEASGSRSQERCIRGKDSKLEASSTKIVTASPRKGITDRTYAEIQRIKRILFDMYERNGGVPVCYFRFTVDPHSFSRTIENMFHLSFLIKEREVYLSMDDNNLPVIEPCVLGRTTEGTETEITQSVLTMNVEKWKQLVEVFQITRPSITPSRYGNLGIR